MILFILWTSTVSLKMLLIGVSLWKKIFPMYLAFYFYIGLTTLLGLLRLYVKVLQPSDYLALYWWTQFLIVAVGYGVTWEIFSLTLRFYPGVRKLARFLVTGVFLVVILQFLLSSLTGPFAVGVMSLERNMRAVEVTLLLSLVGLIINYGLSIGRNLFGIFLGYGLFLTSHTVALFLHNTLGPSAQSWLNPFRQICELLVLFIWLATLWNEHPVPFPTTQTLEEDYAVLSARTSRLIARARAQIMRIFAAS